VTAAAAMDATILETRLFMAVLAWSWRSIL
jgi:hypothetical protein